MGATRKILSKLKGMNEAKVEKIKDATTKDAYPLRPNSAKLKLPAELCVRQRAYHSSFVAAMELGHIRKRVMKVSTGSERFRSILG
jgi:meiotic recombination protein DMC1